MRPPATRSASLRTDVTELVAMFVLTMPVIMDDTALRELLGDVRKTSYEEGIRQTLSAMSAETAAVRSP